MRLLIATVSMVGTLFFGVLFVVSFVDPVFVETQGARVVQREIENRIGVDLDGPIRAGVSRLIGKMKRQNDREIARIEDDSRTQLPARIRTVMKKMQNAGCECRKLTERAMTWENESKVRALSVWNERLERLIQTKYLEVTGALMKEFRIFTGMNALLFAALGMVLMIARRASVHLVPAAVVLLAAFSLSAYLYVFNQDWIHTVVFGDYLGFGYTGYVGLTTLMLSDIVFLRGLVTTAVLNALATALGLAASVVAC